MHMQSLAVDMGARQHRLEAQLAGKADSRQCNGGIEMRGEGIRDEDHDGLAFFRPQLCQSLRIGHRNIEPACLITKRQLRQGGQGGQPHQTHQRLARRRLHRRIVDRAKPRHHGQQGLDRGDERIFQRTQISPVIGGEKFRPERRDADLDRALPGAGLAGQAAIHGRFHLMGKIVPIGGVETVQGAAQQGETLPPHQRAARVESFFGEQPQPFAHQRCAPLGRQAAVAARLVGGAHGARLVEIETGSVAVAIGGIVEGGANLVADGPVQRPPQRNFIDLQQRRCIRAGDLAGVQAVFRIEGALDFLKAGIKVAEKFRHIFRAHALAMLAPEHAAIFAGERHHRIADLAHQRHMIGPGQIERRAHMQHAGVDMTEHAIGHACLIQKRAKLADIGGKMFGRHGGVFDESNRPHRTFDISEKTDGPLAHGPDGFRIPVATRNRMAQTVRVRRAFQCAGHGCQLLLQLRLAIGQHLDNVDAIGGPSRIVGKEAADRGPDDIALGEA